MLEIYKENLIDLMGVKKDELKIKENPSRGIYIENLSEVDSNSKEEILKIIDFG